MGHFPQIPSSAMELKCIQRRHVLLTTTNTHCADNDPSHWTETRPERRASG